MPGVALEVIDDSGRRVQLDQPAQRIVSLAPHTTELLFAAGAGDAVAGVASYSDYPPEARQRAHIGDSQNLNLEAIVALQPDLVVAWQGGNLTAQVERLQNLGLTVFYSDPHAPEDVASNLERLGHLAGSDAVAGKAASAFRDTYRQLQQRYSQRAPVRVFYEIWYQPLMTVNAGHLIDQVIRLCGGRNVFADLDTLTPTVSVEAVLAAQPEVIIVGAIPEQAQDWLQRWQDWPQLPAVQHRQLYDIHPDLLHRQTLRILQGAQLMCEQLEHARSVR
ncbi:MAG TPA: cobalamin-binding protein [Gammaproteobacteria bacterium]|nr:cobalamin-binding protein [Gammaproteobacteria bacterium]